MWASRSRPISPTPGSTRASGWGEPHDWGDEDERCRSLPPPERGRACPGLDPGSASEARRVGIACSTGPLQDPSRLRRYDPPLSGEGDRPMLIRPFLGVPKARLIATLRAADIGFVDDPTNRDPRFARPRLRRSMAMLATEGLDAKRLA